MSVEHIAGEFVREVERVRVKMEVIVYGGKWCCLEMIR